MEFRRDIIHANTHEGVSIIKFTVKTFNGKAIISPLFKYFNLHNTL